ncbi:MAG: ParA family protein [Pseudomonadota bacterium]
MLETIQKLIADNGLVDVLQLIAGVFGAGWAAGWALRWLWNRAAVAKARERAATAKAALAEDREKLHRALTGKVLTREPNDVARRLGGTLQQGPKVVVICNLKGGVGKTTLAANFGAYLADTNGPLKQRVLFIDLDFQGSLSATLANTINERPRNRVVSIYEDHYQPMLALNQAQPVTHERMQGCRFLDADTRLAVDDERLKYRWALGEFEDDMRYRLTRFLQEPQVRSAFDAVVIDCPPRDSLLTYSAYAAATHVFVPTRLDRLSTASNTLFLASLAQEKAPLWPSMRMGGFIASMTKQSTGLTEKESVHISDTERAALDAWGEPVTFVGAHVPTKVAIADSAGLSFAYFDANDGTDTIFSGVGEAMARRIGYVP